ncbi:uncharacterized protein LTR77_010628 [Saxophila tyrrhenica]|uniref:Uncharacterized protein n=1 Tax=Saxophila tyrrhenica TaxID=1690608 RepID=A0AAV9NVA7_9PEZI|nr:hypothetical protein LTR77_010628 [Saxophila tyrrhenica]
MRWPLKPATRKISHNQLFPETQHPDLPLSPRPQSRSPRPQGSPNLNRSATVSERNFNSTYAGDRRSIAIEPGFDQNVPFSPDDFPQASPPLTGGLSRSQTVSRREGARRNEYAEPSPAPLWSPDFVQLPTPSEQPEAQPEYIYEVAAEPMSAQYSTAPGKTSSDSGHSPANLDRWSQRRLQRLNTEQGFREQRQGGAQGVLSPPGSLSEQQGYNNAPYPAQPQEAQPQAAYHQASQPQPQHPSTQPSTYHSSRTVPSSHTNTGLAIHTQPISTSSRGPNYTSQESLQQQNSQYSPPDAGASYLSQETSRPQLASSRSYSNPHQQQSSAGAEEPSMSSNNNGSLPAPRAQRSGNSNRQSMHNGLNSREGSALGGQNGGQQGVPAFNASVVPAASQGMPSQATSQGKSGDVTVGRITPQPTQSSEDMTEEDVNQLIKDHKELREKYTKVKKYYFEKEDQVKQLQNSLAHQRLSQSRTSLDDSEYSTRFNRLDGLVAQLAFSIRKSWKSVPQWLMGSVNRDAVATGKQEMTAAGRAFISCWIVSEVFDKIFHPDLEPTLSAQLKSIQTNIRRSAPPSQTSEDDENLTSKVVSWRLSTLEGLQESLRSPSCADNRTYLTESLQEGLCSALATHLHDPPPSDLEGGVHMIVELVVSIAIHLPLESRDVNIQYYMPGHSILQDQMKLESGIPPLQYSALDDAAERSSMRSAHSDMTDNTEGGGGNGHGGGDKTSKGRSMLSAITGGSGGREKERERKSSEQRKQAAGATGSSSSLNRPESSQGVRDMPRVRMAAGIGVAVRGRSVLVKAPVFGTT